MDQEAVQVGDFVYLAPEVLNYQTYNRKADVYSFAIVILELLYNKRCFENERSWYLDMFIQQLTANNIDAVSEYKDSDPQKDSDSHTKLSESLFNLISWCTRPNPEDRPDMELVLPAVADVRDEKILLQYTSRRQNHVPKRKMDTALR